jgi:hypothetical protein
MKEIQKYYIPITETPVENYNIDLPIIEAIAEYLLGKGCKLALIKGRIPYKDGYLRKIFLCRTADSEDDNKFFNNNKTLIKDHKQLKKRFPAFWKVLKDKVEVIWQSEDGKIYKED